MQAFVDPVLLVFPDIRLSLWAFVKLVARLCGYSTYQAGVFSIDRLGILGTVRHVLMCARIQSGQHFGAFYDMIRNILWVGRAPYIFSELISCIIRSFMSIESLWIYWIFASVPFLYVSVPKTKLNMILVYFAYFVNLESPTLQYEIRGVCITIVYMQKLITVFYWSVRESDKQRIRLIMKSFSALTKRNMYKGLSVYDSMNGQD